MSEAMVIQQLPAGTCYFERKKEKLLTHCIEIDEEGSMEAVAKESVELDSRERNL